VIFVITGTHEQPFDRLIQAVDVLAGELGCEVRVQSGVSALPVAHATCTSYLPYEEMEALAKEAAEVITHAGPGSVLLAIRHGKVPIVVPRERRYDEHVDDHQLDFGGFLERKRMARIVRGKRGRSLVEALAQKLREERGLLAERDDAVIKNRLRLFSALDALRRGST
jgi:UDP-N-acetylglucosamine transferase subunit ALG13